MRVRARKLDDGRQQGLRAILDRDRTRTYERIRELRNEQQQDATPSPSDEFDEARALGEVETYASLIERAEGRLKAIDHARSRLEQNRYGLCEECGNAIPIVRLRALPFTTRCVRCQPKHDMKGSGKGSIDEASSKLWATPTEMDESLETQDAIVEPEERLFVHDKDPFGTELGEFEQLAPVVTARRRGRIRQRHLEE
jgi:DnaK suppressor protein